MAFLNSMIRVTSRDLISSKIYPLVISPRNVVVKNVTCNLIDTTSIYYNRRFINLSITQFNKEVKYLIFIYCNITYKVNNFILLK